MTIVRLILAKTIDSENAKLVPNRIICILQPLFVGFPMFANGIKNPIINPNNNRKLISLLAALTMGVSLWRKNIPTVKKHANSQRITVPLRTQAHALSQRRNLVGIKIHLVLLSFGVLSAWHWVQAEAPEVLLMLPLGQGLHVQQHMGFLTTLKVPGRHSELQRPLGGDGTPPGQWIA